MNKSESRPPLQVRIDRTRTWTIILCTTILAFALLSIIRVAAGWVILHASDWRLIESILGFSKAVWGSSGIVIALFTAAAAPLVLAGLWVRSARKTLYALNISRYGPGDY
jgi:hypothetical protein